MIASRCKTQIHETDVFLQLPKLKKTSLAFLCVSSVAVLLFYRLPFKIRHNNLLEIIIYSADKVFMNIKEMFPLILQVLKDYRVIVTVIAMILVIKFAKFIASYRKKSRKSLKSRPKTSKIQKEPTKTAESQENQNTKENTDE